ncbi:hypothetical protein [Pseudoalteromonas sp. C8]|uniref:hypothetical protein n=1 Tax=Pseudoalteromonas sp. C8 TaxID=2686345 RepID=UPI0013FDB71F|nr:hypothetical protein [Pseudoalteromonas sp. C8]
MQLKKNDLCDVCRTQLNISGTHCDVCYSDIGFPNIRKAESEEVELQERYELAHSSIKVQGNEVESENFESFVDSSFVVMNRSFTDVFNVLQSNRSIVPFHKQVASSMRSYEQNKYDLNRDAYESKVSPGYYEDIHYGLLAKDEGGSSYYGDVSIKFGEKFIKNRTSFFQDDTYDFCDKHQLVVTEDAPKGYRSTWKNRKKLALIKLHPNIKKGMSDSDMAKLLFDTDTNSYIEAHIYGTISKESFEKVTITSNPLRKGSKGLIFGIIDILEELKIPYEEVKS